MAKSQNICQFGNVFLYNALVDSFPSISISAKIQFAFKHKVHKHCEHLSKSYRQANTAYVLSQEITSGVRITFFFVNKGIHFKTKVFF